MRVLLVDEWIETGAQVTAALELIEAQDAVVVGIATVRMDANPRTAALKSRVRCVSVWHDDDEHP
jgi:adenine/guanine phosphoribosyltransferase-like PRPP-binding protein